MFKASRAFLLATNIPSMLCFILIMILNKKLYDWKIFDMNYQNKEKKILSNLF